MTTMNEHRMVCAKYPEAGHEFHKFPKFSEEGAKQDVKNRNHKAELDAAKPAAQRYFDHACAPYKVQQRPVVEWVDTGTITTELLPYEADHDG